MVKYPLGPKAARVFLKCSPRFPDAVALARITKRTAALLLNEDLGQNPGPLTPPFGNWSGAPFQ